MELRNPPPVKPMSAAWGLVSKRPWSAKPRDRALSGLSVFWFPQMSGFGFPHVESPLCEAHRFPHGSFCGGFYLPYRVRLKRGFGMSAMARRPHCSRPTPSTSCGSGLWQFLGFPLDRRPLLALRLLGRLVCIPGMPFRIWTSMFFGIHGCSRLFCSFLGL